LGNESPWPGRSEIKVGSSSRPCNIPRSSSIRGAGLRL
jgi:hypothetical protein